MNDKIWYAPNKFDAYDEEEINEVNECLKKGWLTPGPYTEKFEKEVSNFFGKKFGVMVNSGSSANMLALCVSNIGIGDEVITCALTFSTTVAPIIQRGATPIFIDSDNSTFVPTVESIINAITPKTKAILLANLAGSKPDWEQLKKLVKPEIILIEDSCDTMTHTIYSDISTTSFYASHIITAGGGGGMVMFNDKKYVNIALMFRDWGRIGNNSENMNDRFEYKIDDIFYDFKFLYEVVGYNFKSTEMNAAFGLVQMKKLDKFIQKRRENIKRYEERLKNSSFKLSPVLNSFNWIAMPILHPKRKEIMIYLENNNVQTRVFFAGNITRHPGYRNFCKNFQNADIVMNEGFLVGSHQGLNTNDVDYVCDLLLEFERNLK
jgi:CDP-6-deoxy-D-xylo-4-hexulose-3-dehydrase